MIHFTKSPIPNCLLKAKVDFPNWENFVRERNDEYQNIKEIASDDQKGECAYTGLPLDRKKIKVHIDHYKRKSIYPNLTFEWNNLFVAVKDDRYGADYKDKQINRENAEYAYSVLLNPIEDDSSDFFWYGEDGKIVVKDTLKENEKERAYKTIEYFNLNSPVLIEKRSTIMKILCNYRDLSDDDIRTCMKGHGFSKLLDFYMSVN